MIFLCTEREQLTEYKRNFKLLIMLIPIIIICWVMIKLEPAAGDRNLPINSEGGYYARTYTHPRHFAFCNHRINQSMQ